VTDVRHRPHANGQALYFQGYPGRNQWGGVTDCYVAVTAYLSNDKGKGSLLDQSGWKCPGFNDVDVNNKKGRAAGICIVKDTDGDQAYSTWQCEGDVATCSGTFDYVGGTGKYKGINGHNTFLGHIQVNWSDGTSSGYSTINR
jgi:hypothetical protein